MRGAVIANFISFIEVLMRRPEPEVHPAHLQNGPPVFIRLLVDIVT
jgi:hypothetical protein